MADDETPQSPGSGKMLWFYASLTTLVGCDWGTKSLVNQQLAVGEEIPVIDGLLSWLHAENPDAMFSLPVPLPIIVVGGLFLLGALLWTLWQLPRGARVQAAAIGTLAAGAIGNLGDRLLDGSVTDFIRVYTDHPELAPWLVRQFGSATWPIFNVADACIFAGIGLWVVHEWFAPEDDPDQGTGANSIVTPI
ncbi:MAG: signal peptidase II [Myxococcota bacterium]